MCLQQQGYGFDSQIKTFAWSFCWMIACVSWRVVKRFLPTALQEHDPRGRGRGGEERTSSEPPQLKHLQQLISLVLEKDQLQHMLMKIRERLMGSFWTFHLDEATVRWTNESKWTREEGGKWNWVLLLRERENGSNGQMDEGVWGKTPDRWLS